MPGIQFINTNPALDQFNARVSAQDRARRQEEQDFRQRFALEQGQSTDRAYREAVLADIAARRSRSGRIQPTVAAQTAADAATTPVGQAANVGVTGTATAIPLPQRQQIQAIPIDEAPPPPIFEYEAQPIQPARETPVPAGGPAPITSGLQGPVTAGQGTSDEMMTRLAETRGTGKELMRMYAADQTSRRSAATEGRKTLNDAEKRLYEQIRAGDWRIAQAIAVQHGIRIPDEVWRNRRAQAAMTVGARMADSALGKQASPEQRLAYMFAFTESMAQSPDNDVNGQASMAGMKAAQKVPASQGGRAPHFYTDIDNSLQAVGPDLVARPVQGPRARPPQPPFALTQPGIDAREEAGRNEDIRNAKGSFQDARAWERASEQERNRRIKAFNDYRLYGTPLPAFKRGTGSASSSPGAVRPPLDQFYRQ